MLESIIWYITTFGCAVLFYCIGIYAAKRKEPMWFWSGTEVKSCEITYVKQYNKENAIMWKSYSLWFFASGVVSVWSKVAALVIFVAGFTVGLLLLVLAYKRIYKKYSLK